MKTLSQLKKDIEIGKATILTEFLERSLHTRLLEKIEIPKKMQGIRLIVYKNTVGFKLENSKKETSICEFPTAGELQYIDDTFTISVKDSNGAIWQVRTYKLLNN